MTWQHLNQQLCMVERYITSLTLCVFQPLGGEQMEGDPAEEERERGRERESLHLSSHTGLMQVLQGHPLADPITEC